MAKNKISIIGAGGSMGIWFSKYFLAKGFDVIGFDEDTNLKLAKGVTRGNSLVGSILGVDYVLLCTPIKQTPEVIRLIAKEMKRDSTLIEVTSLKTKTASALSKMPEKVTPVSIHPMFGPGSKHIKGHTIIFVPIKDAKKEIARAKSLFADATFVSIDSHEHDRKIALILGMTHLVNLAFANILTKDENTKLTDQMSGTTFRAQKLVTASIMTESSELIETLISNPEIKRYAEEFWKDIGRMLTLIQENRSEEIMKYASSVKDKLGESMDLQSSYKKLVSVINSIERAKK